MEHILPYIFFLACPISMGVMMWMMMRKDHGSAPAPQGDPRVADLESQVNELRIALREGQGTRQPAHASPIAGTAED